MPYHLQACVWEKVFSRVSPALHCVKKPDNEEPLQRRACPQPRWRSWQRHCWHGGLLDAILSGDHVKPAFSSAAGKLEAHANPWGTAAQLQAPSTWRELAAPLCTRNDFWVTCARLVKGTLQESTLGMTLRKEEAAGTKTEQRWRWWWHC